MRKFIVLIVTACLLMAGITQAAPAGQEILPRPQITSFTSTATKVDPTALNNRTARIPVSWTTDSRPNSANLVFEQVLPDGRVVNVELPRDNPWVASNGNGIAAPFPPGGNATSIQLRIRLIDVVKITVYDEKTLTIPIGVVTAPTPTIVSFATSATAVVRSELNNKTARVPVSWQVNDRPDTSNLVFEQVLANGTSVNVELPRQNPWVASSGVGVAAPINPGNNTATTITLRLRVIDLATQQTQVQKDITVPVSDTGPTPSITTFTTTSTSVNRAALVNKTARVPVTWAAVNRPANSNLVFEQLLDNGTVVNVELPRQNPYVSSEGNGMAAPVNPGTSGSIKLQVRLVDLTTQNTLAKRELAVTIVEGGNLPKIAYFTTSTASVDYATLVNKTARIPVSWLVDNRPNGSNLVFEQVLANGTSVNVELPRQNPWVASLGIGVTAPVSPGGDMSYVQLRLRLVDVANNTTLDSKDITVPINGRPNQTVWEKNSDSNQCFSNGFPQSNGIVVGSNGRFRLKSNIPNGRLTVADKSNAGLIIGEVLTSDTFRMLAGPDCYKVSGGGLSKPIYLRFWHIWDISSNPNLGGWVSEYFMESSTGAVQVYLETVPDSGGNAPQIVSFTADPSTATPGSQVSLAWEVKNATAISITQLPASINAMIANQVSGTTLVAIPVNASGTVTLELIASNAAGQETRATVNISIVGLPETGETCQFPSSLTEDCPQTQETVSAAYQSFENGHMVWNGSTKQIYVLFPDGHWEQFADTWQVGEAEPVPGGEPPPVGQYVPERGFGKVWTQLGGYAALGWATSTEQSYQATWETHALMDGGLTSYTPHFTLPDGRVAHLGMQWTID
jgi:hypothetical protein